MAVWGHTYVPPRVYYSGHWRFGEQFTDMLNVNNVLFEVCFSATPRR